MQWNWKINSKTDVGVSAVGQVACARVSLPGGMEPFVDRLNQHLPDDIRCFDVLQTSKSFNARTR
jgi:tRNA U38,U39,U40 pseudouridine synthase TruA